MCLNMRGRNRNKVRGTSNSLKKKEEAMPAAPAAVSNAEKLLGEIRDLLKQR